MLDDKLKIKLLALSARTVTSYGSHADSVYGYHVLKAYAREDPFVRERTVIHIGNIRFADRFNALQTWIDDSVDVVGLTCQPWSVAWVERMIADAHEHFGSLRIWVGGEFVPSLLARGRVRWSERDLIFTGGPGEAEEPFRRVVRALASDGTISSQTLATTPGLAWWSCETGAMEDSGRSAYTPLAKIPSPYLSGIVDFDPLYDRLWMRAGWGCPGRCRFCAAGRDKAPGWSIDLAPIQRISEEIAFALEVGCGVVGLYSHALNYDEDHMTGVLEAIPAAKFSYIDTVLSLSRFTRGQAAVLACQPEGIYRFNFAIQTLSAKACKNIGRACLSLDDLRTKLGWLAGSTLTLDYMFPLPGESFEEFKRNVSSILELGLVDLKVNQLVIAPHLAFGREREAWGFESVEVEGMEFAAGVSGFPRDDVERAQDWLRSVLPGRGVALDARFWQEHCHASSGATVLPRRPTGPEPASGSAGTLEDHATTSSGTAFAEEDRAVLLELLSVLKRHGTSPRLTEDSFEVSFKDEDQPGGTSRVAIVSSASGHPFYKAFGAFHVLYHGTLTERMQKVVDAIGKRLSSPRTG